MAFLQLMIILIAWRYSPIIKKKADIIYQEKFNITLFSKENCTKLLYATIFVFSGKYSIRSSRPVPGLFEGHFPLAGYIFLSFGFYILLRLILNTYKKTDQYYGTIAAALYLFIVVLQYFLGWLIFLCVFAFICFLRFGNTNDDNYY